MDRTQPVRFFKGLEIEGTNFFLLPTMIAPGQYDYQECTALMAEHKTDHILLGFMYDPAGNPLVIDLARAFAITNQLMADGKKVTLEIRPDQLTDEFVSLCPEADSPESKQFVILIGSYFPQMSKIGGYTTLKLHSDHLSTNNGVWCIKAEDYAKHGQFTPWEAYEFDIFIK